MFQKVVFGLVAGAFASLAMAGQGYVTTKDDGHVKSNSGLCWKTKDWTPAVATKECDPELFKTEVVRPVEKTAGTENVIGVVTGVSPSIQTITFPFGKTTINEEAKAVLVGLADTSKGEIITIEVTGHADRIGSEAFNQTLSEKRAAAVKGFLVSKGVASEKIKVFAKGETEPVVQCKVAGVGLIECLTPNRRVELKSVKK